MYAVLPILGIVIGATLQYLFSRSSEKRKHQQDLRTQTYVDFLQWVGRIAIAQRNNDKDKVRELIAFLTDTKLRICVYGSKEVVEKLAEFDRAGATISGPEGINAFINIIQAMRKESLPKDQSVPDGEIYQVLFGNKNEHQNGNSR
jgi:hypothetical protein